MIEQKIIVKTLPIFEVWLKKQTDEVQEKVIDYINRLKHGNTSNLKSVKKGIVEDKIYYGKGIRIYLIEKNEVYYIVLWGGADKKRQQADIEKAVKIKQMMEANENEKNKQ
ncbi:MAG: hypothetical protein LBT79_00980 [Elusimicrobiota bacterium]|jgi:putative addiction module killer protein|nr:hypothetical protein [Elusimicrobiota bacterium]